MDLRKMTDAQIWEAWNRYSDMAAACKSELDYRAEMERRTAGRKKRKAPSGGYPKANIYNFPNNRR